MKKSLTVAISLVAFTQTLSLAAADGAPQLPPPAVVVDEVRKVSEAAPIRYVGLVETIRNAPIMPRVTGTLEKVHFTEGDMVQAGQLLYELEDTTYQAAVDALSAEIEAQKAAIEFATAEYNRKHKLLQSNAVAAAAHDKALMEIVIAKANMKRLQAALTDAKNTLSYTKLYSPITGRIGKSNFTPGNLITPQSGELANVKMTAPIYVKFSISERVLRRDFGGINGLKKMAKVQLELADGSIYRESAKVTLADNKINESSNTLTMWATFANQDQQLLPGSFVTVLLTARHSRELLTVLPSALIMEDSACSVYVLDPKTNIPEKRAVKPGNTANGRQVILSGVNAGECVVVDGTHKIQPGKAVKPVPAAQLFKGK